MTNLIIVLKIIFTFCGTQIAPNHSVAICIDSMIECIENQTLEPMIEERLYFCIDLFEGKNISSYRGFYD